MTQNEALIAALQARGEREVHPAGVTKYRVFTRSFMGTRNEAGQLTPVGAGTFWFVPKRGTGLRYGTKSSTSQGVSTPVRQRLAKEAGRG